MGFRSPFGLRDRIRAAARGLGGGRLDPGPHAVVVEQGGTTQELSVEGGTTLLAALVQNRVDVAHYCGGGCSCGTCIVDVLDAGRGLSSRGGNEELVLGSAQVSAGQRLACQARVLGPVRVRIPDRY